MSWIVLEVLARFYFIHKKSVADAKRIERLAREYERLELEKKEFEDLSTTDAFTGIMNRAGIQHFLQRLHEGGIEGDEVGLLLFDIDHFKKINDQFGQDVGDQVLIEMATIIRGNIRQADVFGRWGGEEFILLCPKMPESSLKAFAEKIREAVERYDFSTQDRSLRATVSVGATSVGAQEEFQTAFKRADVALYQAKNSGRNQVRFAST